MNTRGLSRGIDLDIKIIIGHSGRRKVQKHDFEVCRPIGNEGLLHSYLEFE